MKNRSEDVKLRKGDTVVLRARTHHYYNRTDEEVQEYYDLFAKNGQVLDDAGEPRVVSKVGAITLPQDTVAFVTRVRGIEWKGWGRRPVGLVEGIVTLNDMPRFVLFFKKDVRKLSAA